MLNLLLFVNFRDFLGSSVVVKLFDCYSEDHGSIPGSETTETF